MIKVAIVGVGNCASSLIQGKFFYQHQKSNNVSGLLNNFVGPYSVENIEFVCAFDVDKRKVGKDLSEAIFQSPNNAFKFQDVPFLDAPVLKGNVLDGVAEHMGNVFLIDSSPSVDVAAELKNRNIDILINYLPVGSKNATEFYANECLKSNVAFINAIPEFICSRKEWADRFAKANIPCAGDDIKSQIGATIINRVLTELIYSRGCEIENMYQLNIGGNTDFENMTEEYRLKSKRVSKTQSVLSIIGSEFDKPNVKIGPSEHVPHLKDTKICYINIRGRQFAGLPFELDLKLKVEDGPNSAGIMLDVIRMIKIAKDNGLGGNVPAINAFAFKSPSIQYPDNVAIAMAKEYINKY